MRERERDEAAQRSAEEDVRSLRTHLEDFRHVELDHLLDALVRLLRAPVAIRLDAVHRVMRRHFLREVLIDQDVARLRMRTEDRRTLG